MSDRTKRSVPKVGTFRHYWWGFAIVAIAILLGVLKTATVQEDSDWNATAPVSAPLAEIPAGGDRPEAAVPAPAQVEAATDNLELPIPEDVQAIARYFGTSGRKNIGDAAVLWQKRGDKYIDFLRNETFEQGIRRAYMISELLAVTKSMDQMCPQHPDIVRLLARTRRMSKLIWEVNEARQHGDTGRLVESINSAINRFVKERRALERTIEDLIETEPDSFTGKASREQMLRVSRLARGFGLIGLDVPEGVIPMSLQGTQFGIVTSCFLLGLAEDGQGVPTLLDVLSYNDKRFIEKLADVWGLGNELVASELALANRLVIADALDRILVVYSRGETGTAQARALANQYEQWRRGQQLAPREVMKVFTYDSPTTPYHLPGMILGVKKGAKTFPLKLPVVLWQEQGSKPNVADRLNDIGYRVNEEVVTGIIDWARRFDKVLGRL